MRHPAAPGSWVKAAPCAAEVSTSDAPAVTTRTRIIVRSSRDPAPPAIRRTPRGMKSNGRVATGCTRPPPWPRGPGGGDEEVHLTSNAQLLAGHVVTGDEAHELVPARLEVGHQLARGAGREVLALGEVGALVEQAAARLGRSRRDRQAVGRRAGVRDREGDVPGLDARLIGLDPHVAERRLHRAGGGAAAGAAAASGPATLGAPVVCRMPAVPLTMSPNACVTNG